MKPLRFVRLLAVIGAVALGGSPTITRAALGANVSIHPLLAYLSGVRQGVNGEQFVEKFTGLSEDLVNLATGNEPGDPLPANLILALAIDCDTTEAQIVVFDTNTDTIVTNVASSARMTDHGVVATSGGELTEVSYVFVMSLVTTDTMAGGGLLIAGSAKFNTVTGCAVSAKLAVTGEIATVTDGSYFITRGKMSARKPIVITAP